MGIKAPGCPNKELDRFRQSIFSIGLLSFAEAPGGGQIRKLHGIVLITNV